MIVAFAVAATIVLSLVSLVAVAIAAARERSVQVGPNVADVRTITTYLLSFASLIATGTGATWTMQAAISWAWSIEGVDVGRTLALGISLAVVGVPTWWAFWRSARRQGTVRPALRSSLVHGSYLTIVRTVAILTVATAGIQATAWILGTSSFDARPLATVAVWLPVWWAHVRLDDGASRLGASPLLVHRLHVYLVATVTLGVAAVSVARLASSVLSRAYVAALHGVARDGAAPEGIASGWGALVDTAGWPDPWRVWAAAFVVAGAVWGGYVVRVARPASDGWPRDVYLYLAGVLPGTVAVLAGIGTTVYQGLQIVLGGQDDVSAVERLTVVPAALAAAMVGGVVWAWHATVDARRAAASRDAQRIVRYLLASVSLAVAGFGVARSVAALARLLAEGGTLWTSSGLRDPLVLGLTSSIVGGGTWVWVTARLHGALRRRPVAERAATPRRVYLTTAFAVALAFGLTSLGVATYLALEPWLSGRGSTWRAWLEAAATPLGIVVASMAIAVWHSATLASDRRLLDTLRPAQRHDRTAATAKAIAPVPSVVLIVGAHAAQAARAWAARWPAPVDVYVRTREDRDATSADSIDRLATAVAPWNVGAGTVEAARPVDTLIVEVDEDETRVTPVARR